MMTGMTNGKNILFLFLFVLLCTTTFAVQDETEKDFLHLIQEAKAAEYGSPKWLKLWRRLLKLQPRWVDANVQVGLALISNPNEAGQREGIRLLEKSITPGEVDNSLAIDTIQGLVLSSTVGRWHIQMEEHHAAQPIIEAASNQNPNDLCMAALSATLFQQCPDSIRGADESMARYLNLTQRLIQRLETTPDWRLDQQFLSSAFPGAGPDPYSHCMCSLFSLSFYYRADIALVASRHYQIGTLIWPELSYVSEKAKKWTNSSSKRKKRQKIRLGIVSAMLSSKSSVVEDFKGTMSRLDRKKFQVTYIYIPERPGPIDPFVYTHSEDKLLILEKKDTDFGDGAWIKRFHPMVESLNLDILFYLDLTMSPQASRLAFAKLAPVQATSHGHPVTSGIPATIMNYYISWGAAELEYDTAKTHYTEELKFLPTKSLHQFYTPRANEDVSLIDGQNYRRLVNNGRAKTFASIPADGHWYTCMQKPFKLHPEMDELLCEVLAKDPLGRLVLHTGRSKEAQEVHTRRLVREGCDMSRIHFLDALPHYRLLALYALSDVVLDSYPAGGCTTTREVLAIGKALVTLPARLLGSRWSYAYYQMMGDEELNRMVVAQSRSEYVDLAVQLGTSQEKRNEVEQRIKRSIHRIYESWDSVKAWEKVFVEIAPVAIDYSDAEAKHEL